MIEITIPGIPIGKARHRHTKWGAYSPQSEVERGVIWEIKKQIGDYKPTEKPLRLSLDAYFPRAKSHYGTGRNSLMVKKSSPTYHTKKPDIDNIFKFYMDCMNGILYKDDAQVVAVDRSEKHWIDKDKVGYVRLVLSEIE